QAQAGNSVDLGSSGPRRAKLKDATTRVTDAIPGVATDWLPAKSVNSILENDDGTTYELDLARFALKAQRAERATVIQAFTNAQLTTYARALPEFKVDVPVTRGPDHHIGGFIITKPDGTRYVYGIPVYNH